MRGAACPDVTGAVLAGGRSLRMGGADKGLAMLRGQPLVAWALQSLAPQVARTLVVSSRPDAAHAALEAMGAMLVPDGSPDQPGPLAGMLGAMRHATTDWVACLPCDVPWPPVDLVARLRATADAAGAPAAVLATRSGHTWRFEPVFVLLHRSLAGDLAQALDRGERAAHTWLASVNAAPLRLFDPQAIAGANTPQELLDLERRGPPPDPPLRCPWTP
jgi:molybdopterin-guanine dinucleotide biosynthesis protein A